MELKLANTDLYWKGLEVYKVYDSGSVLADTKEKWDKDVKKLLSKRKLTSEQAGHKRRLVLADEPALRTVMYYLGDIPALHESLLADAPQKWEGFCRTGTCLEDDEVGQLLEK